ncbi:MAG: cation transporter [Planctomycetia bacterium]|nr:cation transporter [Planctomycetia bacterium]
MKHLRYLMAASLCLVLALGSVAQADTKVELKNVHLCCFACVGAAKQILKKVEGVKAEVEQEEGKISITAPDRETAQKALDALAAGGFHGDTGDKDLAIKDDSGAKAGKVEKVKVVGIHNCCATCTKDIKSVLKKVEGVKKETVTLRKTSFEVMGDIDASKVIKALNDAGYHARIEK